MRLYVQIACSSVEFSSVLVNIVQYKFISNQQNLQSCIVLYFTTVLLYSSSLCSINCSNVRQLLELTFYLSVGNVAGRILQCTVRNFVEVSSSCADSVDSIT